LLCSVVALCLPVFAHGQGAAVPSFQALSANDKRLITSMLLRAHFSKRSPRGCPVLLDQASVQSTSVPALRGVDFRVLGKDQIEALDVKCPYYAIELRPAGSRVDARLHVFTKLCPYYQLDETYYYAYWRSGRTWSGKYLYGFGGSGPCVAGGAELAVAPEPARRSVTDSFNAVARAR
jgi:hypothetical protein